MDNPKPALGQHVAAADTSVSKKTYVSDYRAPVTTFHALRTAQNSASHLVPHLKPDARVLDVGCGPGSITFSLAELVPQGHVTGVDYSADPLPTREKFEAAAPGGEDGAVRKWPGNVEFRVADALALPFAEDSFDVVHAHQVLQHVADPVAVLREMRRVVVHGSEQGTGTARGIVALRESAGMLYHPPLPFLARWETLRAAVASARGGHPNPGARLHVWAQEAGWQRSELACSAGTWCFADRDGREAWAATMAGRAEQGEFRRSAVEGGWASEAEMDEFAREWTEWGRREDAWWTVVHGELRYKRDFSSTYLENVQQLSWAIQGLVVYDDLISAGLTPTLGIISQVLGCLRVFAQHILYEERRSNSIRNSENLTTINLEDACGIYLPRALTVYEDATTLGIFQTVNYAAVPTSVDMRNVPVYAGEVGVLALLKGLKHRHDEGLYMNLVKLIFAFEVKGIVTARGGFKGVHVSSRTGEAVMSLLRKLRIKYEGRESEGAVTIGTSAIRN